MEKKTLPAYRAVLQLLKDICPNLNPEVVMTDWEYSQQVAWQEAFPGNVHPHISIIFIFAFTLSSYAKYLLHFTS